MSQPVRISDFDIQLIDNEIEASNRSRTAQVEYWMRLGRVYEQSNDFDYNNVKQALKGQFNFDNLSAAESDLFIDKHIVSQWNHSGDANEKFEQDMLAEGLTLGEDDLGNIVEG